MERWLALALVTAAATASAQGTPGAAPVLHATAPGPAAAATPAAGADLAFEDMDARMTVPVAIAGAGPFRFIIDTGAQRSVISRQLAEQLRLPRGRRVRLIAMSGAGEVDTVIVPSLSVSTLGGERIEAPALEASHLGAPGMLGIDTLQNHAITIDFDRRLMTVVPAASRPVHRVTRPDEIVIRARSLFGQLVVTDASIAGRKVRVVLDTGTTVSIGNLALKRLVTRADKGQQAEFTSVLGAKILADYAIVRQMKLGDATIESLPVAFADAAPFRAFGLEKRPAILLGMDALKLFRRVDIDFANRELRLVMPRNVLRRS
jgi:predicted aspartyl protease